MGYLAQHCDSVTHIPNITYPAHNDITNKDEANETARSSNPPPEFYLPGGSKLLAISGRGQKTHHNLNLNVVENITYPAPHRQQVGSATLPENKILGEGY